MKTNAVIRIVLYSFLIVILVAILAMGLGAGMLMIDFGDDSTGYITGETSIKASEIRNIEIEWASGNITILTADTDTVTISESGNIKEADQMVYEHTGDTLTVQYSKPSLRIGFFSTPSKNLTVTVPSDWYGTELDIECASADVSVKDITIENISLSSASGVCHFDNCTVNTFDVDTASGDIHYTGYLQYMDCDAASANITAVFAAVPRQIEVDSASGDMDITLPADSGFTLDMDTLSGKFSSDFSTTSAEGRYISGDGICKITFDSASGDIQIKETKNTAAQNAGTQDKSPVFRHFCRS